MVESSRTFNFDDFDQQIADALDENEQSMRPITRLPGEIGGVVVKTSFELINPPEL